MTPLIFAMAAASLGLASATQDAPGGVLLGVWGGDRLVATFAADGAKIRQDCAEGGIPAPVRLDPERRFEVAGVYEPSRPGPQMESPNGPPAATFSGRIVGSTLRLTIHPAAGAPERSYVLERDQRPRLVRCY